MWRSARRGALAALGALSLLAACSAPATPSDVTRAERYERAGDDQAALASWEAATDSCRREREPKLRARWCGEAGLGRAATLERLGQPGPAADVLEALAADASIADEARAGALVSAARLRDEAGDAKRAYDLSWQALLAFPEVPQADDALRFVVRDGRARDARQLYGVLLELYGRLHDTAVGDNLLDAAAHLAARDLDDPAAAMNLWDRLARAHPKGALFDDALWAAAQLATERQDFTGAARRYRELLATREYSIGVGSYFTVWLDDAKLALGFLQRDHLGDPAGAVRTFRELPDDYPDSILRDDALWELADTLAATGDAAGACRALAALHQGFPDSKHELERAPALRTRLDCR